MFCRVDSSPSPRPKRFEVSPIARSSVRRELPGGHLHAEHERADLRLVVVEAPPLEPDDVLLGHALVAGRDQRGQLLANPERRLLLLQPLDGVALEHELPVDRGASRASRRRSTAAPGRGTREGVAGQASREHSHCGTKSKVLSVHADSCHFIFCTFRQRTVTAPGVAADTYRCGDERAPESPRPRGDRRGGRRVAALALRRRRRPRERPRGDHRRATTGS